jgi:hypothetical protein
MMMARLTFAVALAIALALPYPSRAAEAAEDPPACTVPGTLTPDLFGWSMLGFRSAATAPAGLVSARVSVGEAVLARLAPGAMVTYAHTPEKPGEPGGFGGMVQIAVPRAATYRVVLGTHAWLDVVSAKGGAVASVAHAKGPACTGIRKMVDFVLTPGIYTLQIVGSPRATAQVMVIPLP